MAIPQKLSYTEADYYALPEDVRAELIDGQIYYQVAPSRIHQKILGKIHQRISNTLIQKVVPVRFIQLPLPSNYGKMRKPSLSLI